MEPIRYQWNLRGISGKISEIQREIRGIYEDEESKEPKGVIQEESMEPLGNQLNLGGLRGISGNQGKIGKTKDQLRPRKLTRDTQQDGEYLT